MVLQKYTNLYSLMCIYIYVYMYISIHPDQKVDVVVILRFDNLYVLNGIL